MLDGFEGRNVLLAWRGRARRWTPPPSEAVVPFDLAWPPRASAVAARADGEEEDLRDVH